MSADVSSCATRKIRGEKRERVRRVNSSSVSDQTCSSGLRLEDSAAEVSISVRNFSTRRRRVVCNSCVRRAKLAIALRSTSGTSGIGKVSRYCPKKRKRPPSSSSPSAAQVPFKYSKAFAELRTASRYQSSFPIKYVVFELKQPFSSIAKRSALPMSG